MERFVNYPDFKPVILKKNSPPKKNVSVVKVNDDNDDKDMKVKKYDSEFIKKIVSFRSSNDLKQQDFAIKVGLQASIIKGIESNTIIYNSSYVQKINNYIAREKQKSDSKKV